MLPCTFFWQLSATKVLLHGWIYWKKPCKLLIVGEGCLFSSRYVHHTSSYFPVHLMVLDMFHTLACMEQRYPQNHLAQFYPFLKLIWRECIKKALLWQGCEAFSPYIGNMYKWFDFVSLPITTWIWGAAFYHLPGNPFTEAQILLLAKKKPGLETSAGLNPVLWCQSLISKEQQRGTWDTCLAMKVWVHLNAWGMKARRAEGNVGRGFWSFSSQSYKNTLAKNNLCSLYIFPLFLFCTLPDQA